MQAPPDADGDGLPDSWEWLYFTDYDEVAGGDPDLDGFTNRQEYNANTDPTDPLDPAPVPGNL
ncbi:MAG: hypothetical protein ABIF71_14645 [Planctomycetota bacterium]